MNLQEARGVKGEADPGSWRENPEMYLAYFDKCGGTFLSFFSVNTGEDADALASRAPLLSWNRRVLPLTLTSARENSQLSKC